MAAAATTAAASTAAHWRERRAAKVVNFRATLGHRRKYGYRPLGWLLAMGTICAIGTHGLQLIEFVTAGWAEVLVNWHG